MTAPSTTLDEHYRLADPFVCLACGGPVDTGKHFCCDPATWGTRFTRPVTAQERGETVMRVAEGLRVGYSSAEKKIDTLVGSGVPDLGDYTSTAEAFAEALISFEAWAAEGGVTSHPADCPDCTRDLVSGEKTPHPVDILWMTHGLSHGQCPVARLHVCLTLLGMYEDLRHGLPVGSTVDEAHRRGRDRAIRRRVEALADSSITDIVSNRVNGGN